MVNHGLSTGMLFLLVGYIYERRHTREMSEFGGVAKSMPVYAVLFAFAMLASVGLPGLNGFVGEFLTLLGAYGSRFLSTKWYAIIGASGVILAAVYLLILYQRIFFGPLTKSENAKLKDLSPLEIGIVIPLVVLFIWIGFQPNTFLRVSESSTRAVVGVVEGLRGIDRYADDVRRRSGDTTTVVPAGAVAPGAVAPGMVMPGQSGAPSVLPPPSQITPGPAPATVPPAGGAR
jgi:NADH:ubiquinone oxidoreductase subunit 4 (subunit M)